MLRVGRGYSESMIDGHESLLRVYSESIIDGDESHLRGHSESDRSSTKTSFILRVRSTIDEDECSPLRYFESSHRRRRVRFALISIPLFFGRFRGHSHSIPSRISPSSHLGGLEALSTVVPLWIWVSRLPCAM
jgi:hypothetical protein